MKRITGVLLVSILILICLQVYASKLAIHKDDKVNTSLLNTSTVLSEKQNFSKTQNPLSVAFSLGNSWENAKTKYTQIDATITNSSALEAKDWSILFTIPDHSRISQSWNGEYSLEGETLTIKPPSSNTVVPPNGTVTLGFILETKDNFKITSVAISAGEFEEQVKDLSNNNTAALLTTNSLLPNQLPSPPSSTGDWLYVKGNKIVDKNGTEVWLTGINWFGYNTGTNTFDGLWAANLEASLKSIADRGFNILRIPISAELLKSWSQGIYPEANYNQSNNSVLNNKNSLQIFDYVIELSRKNGLKIMIDIHCAKTDSMGHMYPVWYNGDITEKDYLNALGWIAERYKSDDTIIAYDLKNEPHGKPNENPHAIWNNSKDANNWKYAAEKAALKVLENNANVLVLVEGTERYPIDIKKNGDYKSQEAKDYYFNWWGGNLRGVKDYPINLGKYQNKLVYSPHDYGPSVYQQPWFKDGYTYDSLYQDCWRDNWMYIYEKKTAPLLIGEWGGFMKEPNLTWMTHLRKLIITNKLHHTFWCFNANSGDTGGLVQGDFATWDEEKYNFVKSALWTYKGKFVSLDQEIPLGKNGIALEDLKNKK
jgi:aryl-phospho-beta-D-glucosidase BglC (GH1 family)